MLGISHIAVGGQKIGESADFATAHRIGLSGERERSGPWLADLSRRKMKVDQSRVVVGAMRRLVEPLTIQRERGGRRREPACRLDDVGSLHAADARGCLGGVFTHGGFE